MIAEDFLTHWATVAPWRDAGMVEQDLILSRALVELYSDSRALFEQNLHKKRTDRLFTADIGPLLAQPERWDLLAALDHVQQEIIVRLPGEPWAGREDSPGPGAAQAPGKTRREGAKK